MALSADEYYALRGGFVGATMDVRTPAGAHADRICSSLAMRHCFERFEMGPGMWGYRPTELGRLALRVSRPPAG